MKAYFILFLKRGNIKPGESGKNKRFTCRPLRVPLLYIKEKYAT